MSITDELRRWNTGRLRPDHAGALDAIADRIDEQHRKALERVAAMVVACPLEARVAVLERKLNHKGGTE